MNILIVGAGAIGGLVGAKLANCGQTIIFAGRPRFAQAVRTHGLVLCDETGRHPASTITAGESIADACAAASAPFDLAILTVKSYDTGAALAELRQAHHAAAWPLPPVLSLQNGVGNEEAIAAELGAPVLAGVITTPVSVPAPAVIQVDRPSYTLGMSPWNPRQAPELIANVQHALADAGFRVKLYPHAQGLKWTKLLMNMMTNALSAILDTPPDALLRDPRLAALEIDAWREALRVMARAGIPPVNLGSYPFRVLAPAIRRLPKQLLRPLLAAQVGKARGGKMPSLHIDLHQGRARSEVTWLNGAVVKKGEELGVPTPVNRLLTETLHSLVDNPQAQAEFRNNPARLLERLKAATNR